MALNFYKPAAARLVPQTVLKSASAQPNSSTASTSTATKASTSTAATPTASKVSTSTAATPTASKASTSSAATASANKDIIKAKEEYAAALARGDRAAMEAAHAKAEAARAKGGTIGADQTLEQARVSAPSGKASATPSTSYNAQGQKKSTSAPTTAQSTVSSTHYRKPTQEELNLSLEQAKTQWWDARFRGDQAGMDAAAELGKKLREAGAVETDAAKQQDARNNAKLEAQKQASLDESLLNAKKEWWAGYETGDQAAMAAAAKKGEELKKQGAAETTAAKQLDIEQKNRLLLESKRVWWEARLADDQAGMDAAKKRGEELRKAGAYDTAEMAKLDEEYQGKLKAKQSIQQQQEQAKLNDKLVSWKVQWWEARLNDDSEKMNAARIEGEKLRNAGAVDTDRSRAIDAKYGALLQEKLNNEQLLLDAKKRWWDATLNLNEAGIAQAKQDADKLRGKAYVNDHTDAMVTLERENRSFLNAKKQYYTDLLNLGDTSASMDAMKKAVKNGASLSSTAVYEMDKANQTLIEFRKDYWRERADYDGKGWEAVKAQEQEYRKPLSHFSSLLIADISDKRYELDKVANQIIYETRIKWEAHAELTRKELSQPEDPLSWHDTGLKNKYQQMNQALGHVFTRTKLDDVNEQLIGLRQQYWAAVDRYQDKTAKEKAGEWSKLIAENSGMDGLLKSPKTDQVNWEYNARREKLNEQLQKGEYENALQSIRSLQKLAEESGSDVSIRRSPSVSQSSVDGLMVYIKKQEWSNLIQLRSDEDGRLAKAKAVVKNNLGVNVDNPGIKELDRQNFIILKAKEDYWQGVAKLSEAQRKQAITDLDRAAANPYASLSTSMDTAFDQLYRDGIELNLLEWTGKGNTALEAKLATKRKTWEESVNLANSKAKALMSAIGQSFSVQRLDSGTQLDKTLEAIYTKKKEYWVHKAQGNESLAYNDWVIMSSQIESVHTALNAANPKIAKDLELPAFALDEANQNVLDARDMIREAIREGNRTNAESYLRQGKSRVAEGATLDIERMVPNFNHLIWERMTEAESLERKLAFTINHVNDTFTKKEITSLQTSLSKMKVYDGPINGVYDKKTFVATFAYQQLLKSDGRAVLSEKQGADLGREGWVTKDLIDFAGIDAGFGRENKPKHEELAKLVNYFGIGDGMVSQLASDGMDVLNTAMAMNPGSLVYWTETVPRIYDLVKGVVSGDITIDALYGSLKNSVKQEFVEPFQYIKNNHKAVLNGTSSYEEARTFGKNLLKAVEVVATAVSLGTAGAVKLASKLPKLMDGLEDALRNSPTKADELESRVVGGGVGKVNAIDAINDSRKWLESLSEIEVDALIKYKGNEVYQDLNSGLRNGNLRNDLKKLLEPIDSGL